MKMKGKSRENHQVIEYFIKCYVKRNNRYCGKEMKGKMAYQKSLTQRRHRNQSKIGKMKNQERKEAKEREIMRNNSGRESEEIENYLASKSKKMKRRNNRRENVSLMREESNHRRNISISIEMFPLHQRHRNDEKSKNSGEKKKSEKISERKKSISAKEIGIKCISNRKCFGEGYERNESPEGKAKIIEIERRHQPEKKIEMKHQSKNEARKATLMKRKPKIMFTAKPTAKNAAENHR